VRRRENAVRDYAQSRRKVETSKELCSTWPVNQFF
jgi:hypothetical protein